MKNSIAWIFGLIFLGIIVYLGYNSFEIPFFLISGTKKTSGFIYDIDIHNGIGGRGYLQNVSYAYKVGDKYYTDKHMIGKKYGWQHIGNTVLLKYSEKEPTKNNVINFQSDFSKENKKHYYASKNDTLYELKTINNILYYTGAVDSGETVVKMIGHYIDKNDTLIIEPFYSKGYDKETKRLNSKILIKKDIEDTTKFIDLN